MMDEYEDDLSFEKKVSVENGFHDGNQMEAKK